MNQTSMAGTDSSPDVAVVGAGIVGVCAAYELRKLGLDVLLIDKGEPGQGCSFGNSGAISPSSVAPLAMPGVLASVPGMLGRPDSPLFLPWRYLPKAIPWLARFVMASRPSVVQRSAESLARLHADAVERHEQMAREVGVPELIIRRGHLHLYPDEAALKGDAASWNLRRTFGIDFDYLDRDGILSLEPAVPGRYHTGVFLKDQATIRNPHRYVNAIFRAYTERGGRFTQAEVRSVHQGADSWAIDTSAGRLNAGHVVVAAGVWSRKLLEPLGIRLSLESQRGYHVQFKAPQSPVSRTVVLADRKIFVTPMEEGLRVGGTVEFAGLKADPNPLRAQILVQIARESFPELQSQDFDTWMGHRPCMPDSVPVTGSMQRLPGLWLATGHGHLGLTDSVGTGLEIAQGIASAGARVINSQNA